MPNRGSGSPPIHTFEPTFSLQLTATNGAMRQVRLGGRSQEASYGPAQPDSFSFFSKTPNDRYDIIRRFTLTASAGGNIVVGVLRQGHVGPMYYDVSGFRNLIGQEVAVPEPASGALVLAALLGAAGAGAGAHVTRRRRARRIGVSAVCTS